MPNKENKFKYAVIGTGNMGKNHVRTCSELPDLIDLVAVVDQNQALAQNIGSQFGCRFYQDYKAMISKEKPEAVSICVPTAFHYEVTKFCLQQKIHVLLEKPIAMTIEEGEDLLKIADQEKVKLLVGHIERFNPAVNKVKEMIGKGELGKITAIMARRVGGFPPQIKDANIAVDLAIHDIDIINYLIGELPEKTYLNKQRHHIEKREDAVEFFLKYRHCSAYIQANWITPVKIRKLNITGTEGYLEMDYITQKIQFYKSNYDKFKQTIGDFSDYILRFSEPDIIEISIAKKEPLKEEIIYFIKAIQQDQPINSKFALDALKIAFNSVTLPKPMHYFVHPTAEVSAKAIIKEGVKIWNFAHIREDAFIGANCIIGKNVYIDFGVKIGDNCKIQNNVSVYHGVTIEDGVFIGPHVCFTNDKNPRAVNKDGTLKSASDWEISPIRIKKGASLGANSTILPGVTVGEYALIGAGSVVTKNVPDFALVYGNPAAAHGKVDQAGVIEKRLKLKIKSVPESNFSKARK